MRNLKHKLPTIFGTIVIIAFLSLGIFNIASTHHAAHLRDIQINTISTEKKKLESNYQQLNVEFNKAKADKTTTQQQLQEKQKALDNAQQKINDLNSQLQAKAAAKQAEADRIAAASRLSIGVATAAAAAAAPTGSIAGCGDNSYANYIYMHESGCKTNDPNASGCDGIGQACPGSAVTNQCGYDYACQNAYFTNYANSRYGGWAGAYAFWVNNHWW